MTIPVCYGGEYGPDMEEVTNASGLTRAEVIHLQNSVIYTAYIIGFVPGFSYLLGAKKRQC